MVNKNRNGEKSLLKFYKIEQDIADSNSSLKNEAEKEGPASPRKVT